MLYVDMFGARLVCGIFCKCYASLIVAHDGCRSFLHVPYISQKLPKLMCLFSAMASCNVLRLRCRQWSGWLFLAFHKMIPMPTINTYPMVDSWLFASPIQSKSQNPFKAISLLWGLICQVWSALQIPHDVLHGHAMRWTGLWHELAHQTHQQVLIRLV